MATSYEDTEPDASLSKLDDLARYFALSSKEKIVLWCHLWNT